MSSSVPPPPSLSKSLRLRPWYLVAAMVVVWFVGVHGLLFGFQTAKFLRSGLLPEVDGVMHSGFAGTAAELKALLEMRDVAFPLSVGKVLLSALLVVASGLALGGRRGWRSLAIQALVVNASFTAVEYALTRTARVAFIQAMSASTEDFPASTPQDIAAAWWAAERIALTLKLGALSLAALALTRPRTKLYFDAVARATESAEEEP